MSTRTIRTKKELKEAISDKVDTIIISGKLKKELKPVVRVMKMSTAKRAALIGFLSAGGVAVVASVAAAPSTMGISSIVGTSGLLLFSAKSGIALAELWPIILLCVAAGIPTIISLFRMYDIKADEYNFEIGPIKFHRRVEYK